jgi:hypothetical protein
MRCVWLADWLRRADRSNQETMDALAGRIPSAGVGIVIESLSWDSSSDALGYRNRVSIDGQAAVRLPFGTTFHPLAAGEHVLRFSNAGRLARGTIAVVVPEGGRCQVRYRPAAWLGGRPVLHAVDS